MIGADRRWWAKRQLDKAQALIERYGLTVVKVITLAGSTYLVKADGTHLKLVKGGKA